MDNIDKNEFRKYAVKHHRINGLYVDKFIAGIDRNAMPTWHCYYINDPVYH